MLSPGLAVGGFLPQVVAVADGGGAAARQSASIAGEHMANDADWVENVKHWFRAGARSAEAELDAGGDDIALGYEAAHPAALQARHWPDEFTTDR
jgi:hypothetical protein